MGRAKEQWIEEQERGWSSLGDKYVCAKCFSDYALKRFVSENAVANVCDYCGRQSRRAIAAPIDNVLEEINAGLRSQWRNVDDEGIPFDSGEGGYQGVVFDTYDLFYEIIDPFENDQLRQHVIDAFFDLSGLWCKKDY
ncbi:MAG: HEPN-associated N-terminal domain-containing protein, partial [Desulfobaccales bacterium]